jgi:hypothetical protein
LFPGVRKRNPLELQWEISFADDLRVNQLLQNEAMDVDYDCCGRSDDRLQPTAVQN